jgi:hypothetical protein
LSDAQINKTAVNHQCSLVIQKLQVHEPNLSFHEQSDRQKTPAGFFAPSTIKGNSFSLEVLVTVDIPLPGA